MKWVVGAGVGILAASLAAPRPAPVRAVLVAGNAQGYLAPCGCAKPMMGGMERLLTAVRSRKGKDGLFLFNGPLSGGTGRQSEMKVETLSEGLRSAGVTAINLAWADKQMGVGVIEALSRLSGGKLLSSAWGPMSQDSWSSTVRAGPFSIYGSSSRAASPLAAGRKLGTGAGILLLEGDEAEARQWAVKYPQLRLIVYQTESRPPREPIRVGKAVLVSPGSKMRYLVHLAWNGKEFSRYEVVPLGPEVANDPEATRFYRRYLSRVTNERLIDDVPRRASDPYAGSKSCLSCHSEAYSIWAKSKHSKALRTLEATKNDRDPDCVGCHVVGLDSKSGFVDRKKTPDLSDVGCESCHGPAAAHVANPMKAKLPKVDERSCQPCHVLDHSPNFKFPQYWEKIRH